MSRNSEDASSSRALDMLLRRKSGKKVIAPRSVEALATAADEAQFSIRQSTAGEFEIAALRPLCVRIPKAALLIGVGRTKIYHLINRGELETVKVDGAITVTTRSLESYVLRHATVRRGALE